MLQRLRSTKYLPTKQALQDYQTTDERAHGCEPDYKRAFATAASLRLRAAKIRGKQSRPDFPSRQKHNPAQQ